MSKTWQLQEAKAKFSALVNAALTEGPQVVTKHGEDVVVIVSKEEYEKLKPKQSLVEFIRESPLYGVELDLSRKKEFSTREIEW